MYICSAYRLQGIHYNPLGELSTYVAPKLVSDQPCHDDNLVSNKACHSDQPTLSGEETDDDIIHIHEVLFAPWTVESQCSHQEFGRAAVVPVRSGSALFCALLDTGAQVSCVSTSVLESCNHSISDNDTIFIYGIGSEENRLLGCVSLEIMLVMGHPSYISLLLYTLK